MSVQETATSGIIGPLSDQSDYDIRGAWVTPFGSIGEYTLIEDVTATASQTIPDAPTGLTVVDGTGGVAEITVISSASSDQWRTIVYRDGVEVGRYHTNESTSITVSDTSGVGTFTYTAAAENVSQTLSPETAGVTVTIT